MPKSPDAFRTISEVADWLGVQAHVLRFWESKFTQIKPIKRAGGRRYYRPADMLLIGGIKKLLHDDGLTIKGVQKILREQGMSHVADLSQPLDDLTMAELHSSLEPTTREVPTPAPPPEEPKGVVLPFESAGAESAPKPEAEPTATPEAVAPEAETEAVAPEAEAEAANEAAQDIVAQEETAPDTVDAIETETPVEAVEAAPEAPAEEAPEPAPAKEAAPVAPAAETPAPEAPAPVDELPSFLRDSLSARQEETDASADTADTDTAEAVAPQEAPAAETPQEEAAVEAVEAPEPPAPSAPRPRIIDLPPLPAEDAIEATPGPLSALARTRSLSPDQAEQLRPLLARLTALRDQMVGPRKDVRKD